MGHWLEGGKSAVSMCWVRCRRPWEQQKEPQPLKLASLAQEWGEMQLEIP